VVQDDAQDRSQHPTVGPFHFIVVLLAEFECCIDPTSCGRQQLGLIEIIEGTLL
jgi:hypothetical protein